MSSDDARRQALYALLGDLPERDRPISAEKVSEEERETYILERLVLDLNGIERVPAYFARPKETDGPVPVVLYNHAHGGAYEIAKEELISGRRALRFPTWAEQLTGMGYAALCIDTWAFGERRGRTEKEIFLDMLWHGQVLWGMMMYDQLRAIDYLETRDDVDRRRLATMGISMGSTLAWWTAALDPRVKVCIDLCCLTDFQALLDTNALEAHGLYYYVPGLLKHFSAGDINALIAPRAHLSLNGIYDRLTPPAGLDRIDAQVAAAYADAGAPEAWTLSRYETGHMETSAMRAEIVAYLRQWL
jgi:pimeloyl-ACP methyl ester carboxylesterase